VGGILVLLGIMAVGVGLFVVVMAGIASQSGDIGNELSDAQDKLAGWLEDAGVDSSTADQAQQDSGSTTSSAFHALLEGAAKGIAGLTSLVFFLSLTALSLVFLLIDGPKIRAWTERHLGVPAAMAHMITGRTLQSLRGYFFGVTIVALFNATLS
jgi:predicted PurR-regulated permease PerM